MKKIKLFALLAIMFTAINGCKKHNEGQGNQATLPTLTTITTTAITQTTATSGGNITDDGGSNVTERGVCYSTSQAPTTADLHTSDGAGAGSFTSNLTGLTANTIYHVRAYATNSEGTAYGNEVQFTTNIAITLPTITTQAISNITQTTAISGGNVTDDGGSAVTERGICYSANPNPTTADQHTTDGIGTGNFTSSLTGLTASTTYYVRAYATNSEGTAYGNEVQFITTNTGNNTFPGQTVLVNGGTFQMGSPNGTGDIDEHPQHSVTVSSFRISKYEITNQQYADYMNAIGADANGSVGGVEYLKIAYSQISHNGSSFVVDAGKENYPVIMVSWYGAKAYSEYYGGRLPTEAEWEFAARGGNSSNGYIYSGSNTAGDVAWYGSNSNNTTHTVGTKDANELGLYDMSGNVWEWCNDWYDSNYYSSSPSNNPQGPNSGTERVNRGGSWYYGDFSCRVVFRHSGIPSDHDHYLGFRPVFLP